MGVFEPLFLCALCREMTRCMFTFFWVSDDSRKAKKLSSDRDHATSRSTGTNQSSDRYRSVFFSFGRRVSNQPPSDACNLQQNQQQHDEKFRAWQFYN